MAFLTDVFGKKPEQAQQNPSAPTDTPVERVIQLRSHGLSNNQIIQTLQASGYSLVQINNALSQAEIKGVVEPTHMEAMTMPENQMQFQQFPGQQQPMQQFPQMPQQMQGMPGMQSMTGMQEMQQKTDVSRIEEIAEAIIDEKWDDLIKSIERIVEWKDRVEARIISIEQQMKSMKSDFDKLHTSILEKVGDYDQSIVAVGTDIKALEQVFKKILPGFVENVNELGRIADTMKKANPSASLKKK